MTKSIHKLGIFINLYCCCWVIFKKKKNKQINWWRMDEYNLYIHYFLFVCLIQRNIESPKIKRKTCWFKYQFLRLIWFERRESNKFPQFKWNLDFSTLIFSIVFFFSFSRSLSQLRSISLQLMLFDIHNIQWNGTNRKANEDIQILVTLQFELQQYCPEAYRSK